MIISGIEITKNLQNDSFLISLKKQEDNGKTLSEKQLQILRDKMDIKEKFEKPEFKSFDIIKRNFFRVDYHGDYLMDCRTFILTNNCEEIDFKSEISDLHAGQYGMSNKVKEYEFAGKCLIPTNAKNPKVVFDFLYEFNKILEKLNRNKIRTTKNYNYCVRALNNINNASCFDDVDKKLIDLATGKKYW